MLARTFARSRTATRRRLQPAQLSIRHSSDFSRPGPPPLPAHEQREFEALLKRAQTPLAPGAAPQPEQQAMQASSEGEQHPDLRKKPKPEFDGEINPKTGEVGGPKNEPLTHGDWTYGGRCTDF